MTYRAEGANEQCTHSICCKHATLLQSSSWTWNWSSFWQRIIIVNPPRCHLNILNDTLHQTFYMVRYSAVIQILITLSVIFCYQSYFICMRAISLPVYASVPKMAAVHLIATGEIKHTFNFSFNKTNKQKPANIQLIYADWPVQVMIGCDHIFSLKGSWHPHICQVK